MQNERDKEMKSFDMFPQFVPFSKLRMTGQKGEQK